MSTIKRLVVINPVEPSPLSLRAAMGIETRLDVTFLRQNGSPYTTDLAAQLQLTDRSSNVTTFYAMPAVDVVNGRARAVIPAGALADPFGARLRITGTVDGEPALIAYGTAMPIAGAGPQAVPEDVIDDVPLMLTRGQDANIDVRLWHDESKTNPYDLGSATVSATIYASSNGINLMPFTVTVVGDNDVHLSLAAADVDTLPDSCWWTLTIAQGGGLTTLAQGTVTVVAAS